MQLNGIDTHETYTSEQEEQNLQNLSYEQAMDKLEAAATRLQEGSLSLEDTLTLYDEACRLAAHCELKLKDAKQKLTVMTGENDEL